MTKADQHLQQFGALYQQHYSITELIGAEVRILPTGLRIPEDVIYEKVISVGSM